MITARYTIAIVGIFSFLFGGCSKQQTPTQQGTAQIQSSKPAVAPEHCVQVFLKLSGGKFGTSEEVKAVHALSDVLKLAIEEHKAGEFDGDEFGDGVARLFMYGPDADALFDAIKHPLLASPLASGGYAIKRYGPPEDGIKKVRIEL
jgi:hypothetical protein